MAAEYLKIHPDNPEPAKMKKVVDCLSQGGLVIYPTDTVYGLGCDIFQARAIEKIARLKGLKPEKANFSIICHDLSHLAEYAKVSTQAFKLMKKALPGAFTFILPATSSTPKLLNNKKKTIGIRIPDHQIPRTLVQQLGNPIVTTSIHDEDAIIEYSTDPELIFERFEKHVDLVIDGGYGNNEHSTIIDATTDEFEVLRQGLGDFSHYYS
jgi:tRNA threonylcarbamoyl adenosine modification protein (Sua5/YciO/YrdC/YwlC family)